MPPKDPDAIKLVGVMMPANVVLYIGSAATNTLFRGNRVAMSDGQEKDPFTHQPQEPNTVDGLISDFTVLPSGSILIDVVGGEGMKGGQLLLTATGMLCLVKGAPKEPKK